MLGNRKQQVKINLAISVYTNSRTTFLATRLATRPATFPIACIPSTSRHLGSGLSLPISLSPPGDFKDSASAGGNQ